MAIEQGLPEPARSLGLKDINISLCAIDIVWPMQEGCSA
jgi:hypothetical protein